MSEIKVGDAVTLSHGGQRMTVVRLVHNVHEDKDMCACAWHLQDGTTGTVEFPDECLRRVDELGPEFWDWDWGNNRFPCEIDMSKEWKITDGDGTAYDRVSRINSRLGLIEQNVRTDAGHYTKVTEAKLPITVEQC